MKRSLTILTLVFTSMFPSTSFAEWTKMGTTDLADTYYVDLERIRKVDGYVYFWELGDYSKPVTKMMLQSSKRYFQGDCKILRYKILSYVFHKQPMGRDTGETSEPVNKEWLYPPPNSVVETTLKTVCEYVN